MLTSAKKNHSEIILGGWEVSKEIILRWVIVYLKKIFGVGCN